MNDDRELLKALQEEPDRLDHGGYDSGGRWRAPLIFEDSPTCPNYHHAGERVPCSACPLAAFVPAELRNQQTACRFIPLNTRGETIDLLYNWGTPAELEMAVRNWLVTTIDRLEKKAWRAVVNADLATSPSRLLPAKAGSDIHSLLPMHITRN